MTGSRIALEHQQHKKMLSDWSHDFKQPIIMLELQISTNKFTMKMFLRGSGTSHLKLIKTIEKLIIN